MPWSEMLRVTLTLVFIIVLILGLSFGLRRWNVLRSGSTGVFQVLAAISLSSRDKIYLLQVGNEQLVVGSSVAGLNLLHTMQEKIVLADQQQASLQGQRFADLLKMAGKGWTP